MRALVFSPLVLNEPNCLNRLRTAFYVFAVLFVLVHQPAVRSLFDSSRRIDLYVFGQRPVKAPFHLS